MVAAWLTEKDVQDYGHDVLDLAQRAALHAVSPDLARLEHQNEALSRQLAAEQRRGLYQTLDAQLPNWKEIDNDPRWRQWLLFSDPYNKRPRQSLLNDAIAAGDATRVLSFFRGFLAEGPQSPQQPQYASSAPTGKRTYTRADITRYSDAYRRGRISEADYQRLSADIHAAIGEGRISNPPIPKGKAPHG
jgi:hypothetical protein